MPDGQGTMRSGRLRLDDTTIGRWLDQVTARHLRAVIALVALSLACFLPGLTTIAPIDRDEARFAQATKQMLETGDYIDIRLQDEPRYKKPVGIYWLQAVVVKVTGEGAEAPIGAYRLASVVGAVAAVLLLYWATLPLFGRRAAFVAAAALSLSLILAVEAHLAKTDAVLLATVVLAQGALARVYLWKATDRPPVGTALLFWLGIGLGVLVKGPVILMISGLTILALVAVERRAGWLKGLRPLLGVPLAAAVVLPWLLAILSISGVSFFAQSLGGDLFGKVGSGAEGHGAPPGTHFVVFWFIFFPATMLVPLALPWVWRNRATAAVRFALAWIVPNWVVFELVATKLPHYTLPLYPAIAALVGGAVAGGLPTGTMWTRLSAVPGAGFAVHAVTGRPEKTDYLKRLGAREIVPRDELTATSKLLARERWVAGVDSVGGTVLANVLSMTKAGGVIVACGDAAGMELPTSVAPFILRGVTLAGINSVTMPKPVRIAAWERLSRDLDRRTLA
ncbi:MAG: zinc-binding dehydrogenase, partial [Bauldia sp.]